MAQFAGPSIGELPGWRIGLIFLLFCVIAVGFDYGAEALDRHLKRKRKRALRHVVRRLQAELLVLGLLSLLLVVFEPYLLAVCISCEGEACKWDCAGAEPRPGDSSGGYRRRRLLGASSAAWDYSSGVASSGSGGGRQLLASKAGDEFSCVQAEETCGVGSEPFWSQLALVQAHMLLFVIAAVHILYACLSMLICFWKLRRWRRFEVYAMENDLRPLSSRFLPRPGDNAIAHALRCAGMMLADSVTAEVYHGLRRLFIERLDVERSFDFHGFLVESMEEEFAAIVGVHAVLWLFVLLWIMLPTQSWVMVWMSGLAVLAAVVVAIKLQSIITLLAQDAYELYGARSVHKASTGMLQGIKQRLQRLSPFTGFSAGAEPAGTGNGGNLAAGSSSSSSTPDPGRSQRGPQHGIQAPPQLESQQQERQNTIAAVRVSSPDGSSSEEECDSQVVSAAAGLVRDGATPQGATAVAAAAGAAARQQAKAQAVSMVGAASPGVAVAAGHQGAAAAVAAPVAGPADAAARLAQPSRMQQQLETNIRVELEVDLEAQAHPELAARLAGDAAGGAHPRSSVFRRCCPWLALRLPGHSARKAARAHAAVRRSESFSASYRGPDAAALFWGGRPQWMLQVIRAVYFWNSLSIAAAIFSVWQDVTWDWHRYGGWPVIGIMIGVELLLWLFMSLMVLPVYALTTAAGSHSAASVIQHALKNQVKPELARALQRMSMGRRDGPPSADSGARVPAQQGVAAAPLRAPSPRPGGPPRLGRHSAPVPGMLARLSPTLPFFPPAAGSQLELFTFGSPLGGAPSSPQAAAHGEQLATPDHRSEAGEGSQGSNGGEVDAEAMAAAAETAALPRSPKSEAHLSLTRVMGSMYKRQLMRHLEQASSRRALRPAATPPLPDGSWGDERGGTHGAAPALAPSLAMPAAAGSGQGASARFAELPSVADLHGAAGWREGAATETCPPAVGSAWLPDLLQQLSKGQAGAVGAPASLLGTDGGAAGGSSVAAAPSGSRPSFAQVRSLFAEAAAGSGSAG